MRVRIKNILASVKKKLWKAFKLLNTNETIIVKKKNDQYSPLDALPEKTKYFWKHVCICCMCFWVI